MNEGHMQFCTSPEWRQMLEDVVLPDALAEADLGPDVLEIGPGAGFTTDVLRVGAKHVTAVEVDASLASALSERLAGYNVTVLCADATTLDFGDGSFSGAACFNMLHHVPTDDDQDRIFTELGRVLSGGGTLVAADGIDDDGTRAFHVGDIYNPIDPEALPARLERAGFSTIRIGTNDLGWFMTARAR